MQPKRTGPAFFQGGAFFPFSGQGKAKKPNNPDMLPYSHDPPGHTCGLPCCSEEMQVQIRKQKPPRSCIGIQEQDGDILPQNFMFKGKLKRQPTLENGFFSVQEQKEGSPHGPIPHFGSIRSASVPSFGEQQKKFPFLKGREITLPHSNDPNATQKLYLEDFNFGETDDFLDPDDCSSASEIEYYISVKGPHDPERGVPYDPTDLENQQIYPWDLLRDMKDNVSSRAYSERTEDSGSSSSNYYEILRIPEDKTEQSNSCHKTCHAKPKQIQIDVPPPLPPKLPAQNRFNHPPLNKGDHSNKPDQTANPQTLQVPEQTGNANTTEESPSGPPQYNIYSSVCSLTGMANRESKDALEKYRSLDRGEIEEKFAFARSDVRDYDFTGARTYIVHQNMKKTNMKEDVQAEAVKKAKKTDQHKDTKPDAKPSINPTNTNDMEEQKARLLDNMFDNYGEEDDDSGGMINPIFQNVKVEGKVLGSRYMDDNPDTEADDDSDVLALVHRLGELDTYTSRNEEEEEIVNLLKERMQEIDAAAPVRSHDDTPITLIL